jgi:pyrroloquinoline quinone biosynthesis protein B
MRVIVLGSAAGGGLPQWNCGCAHCVAARTLDGDVRPRAQSSIAVSADGERWVLFNASPDVRTQLAATPALWPRSLRHSPVRAVVLTNADIDHAAGLLVLREGGAPAIYCTPRVEEALSAGLRVLPALAAYGRVVVRHVVTGEPSAVRDRDGEATGITVRPFAVTSKPPPYMVDRPPVDGDLDTVGYVIAPDGAPERAVVYVPGVRVLDDGLRAVLAASRCALIDGTFLTDDELVALGASAKTATQMGHAPLRGDDGLVAFLDGLEGPRKVLVHVNNSNPILRDGGEARAWLAAHRVEVAHDGLTLEV